ncbi:MAG TPA: hypothetical protein IAC04_03110 [Candidatus Coprenecus stercoravium]|uniref:Fimbrillin family protein n=1 Tax=Candidatus Coprenecus stercoravium TaxID=2840735 RepID=A0A9D2K9Q9_9BACT|nr:hypothetical protein [Candidatus Coprenecus stercoravium]
MKYLLYTALMSAALLLLSSCQERTASVEESAVEFTVATKAGGEGRLTRLYVAERVGEHDNGEPLHCTRVEDLAPVGADGATSYNLLNMTAQWYKFAFVSVPSVEGVMPVVDPTDAESCDFNSIVIDYTPVIKAQAQDSTLSHMTDLHIYRQVIDRWLKPGETLTEDVTLSRITGRLELDMGIPEDQFRSEIESITLNLTAVPAGVYLRDEADGKILTVGNVNQQIFEFTEFNWGQRQHYVIRLDLLPGDISGTVVVMYKDGSAGDAYRLMSEDGTVSIKAGTRTKVRFNGIGDGSFEVRYAGFPGDDAAVIGVDEDVWNEQ